MNGRMGRRLGSLVALVALIGAVACAPAPAPSPTAAKAAEGKPTTAATAPPAQATAPTAAPKPAESKPTAAPAAAAPATPGPAQQGASLEKVSMRLNWLTDAGVVPHYLTAQKKGFFAEEGLDVEIIKGNGSTETVKLVGAGENTFGQADATAIIQARVVDAPIKAVMAVDDKNPFVILATEKSGIKTLQDLPGKTMAAVVTSSGYLLYKAVLKLNNIDGGQVREVTVPPPGYAQLAQGAVDFLATYDNATPIVKNMAPGIQVVRGTDYGLDVYGVMVFANEQTIKDKPETIKRFLRATKKGMDYTREHPEEVADLLVTTYPELQKPVQLSILQVWTPYWVKGETTINADRMSRTQDLLSDQSVIPRTVPVTDLFTNDFVPG
jgi:NitT/TauT family transport system substrate-binding protein